MIRQNYFIGCDDECVDVEGDNHLITYNVFDTTDDGVDMLGANGEFRCNVFSSDKRQLP